MKSKRSQFYRTVSAYPRGALPHEHEHHNKRRNKETHHEAGVTVCKKCAARYFMKAWHHANDPLPEHLRRREKTKAICPACTMVMRATFDGLLIIPDAPAESVQALMHMIEMTGRRAERRNCQHRIVELVKNESGIVTTTTVSELVVDIARKLRESFKDLGMDLHIRFSESEHELVRVVARSHPHPKKVMRTAPVQIPKHAYGHASAYFRLYTLPQHG